MHRIKFGASLVGEQWKIAIPYMWKSPVRYMLIILINPVMTGSIVVVNMANQVDLL